MKWWFTWVIVGAAILSARPARSQSAAGRRDDRVEKPNFSGTWTLQRDISTDPSRVTFDSENAGNERRAGYQRRGGRGGFGGFGGGAPRRNSDAGDALTSEERAVLRELADHIKRSSASLVISHADPTFAITDPEGHTQSFQTNGVADQHQLASVTIASTTYWDGPRIVTEFEVSGGRRLVYTYTLLPTTKQLVVRIRLEAGRGRATGQELKFVYAANAAKSS